MANQYDLINTCNISVKIVETSEINNHDNISVKYDKLFKAEQFFFQSRRT